MNERLVEENEARAPRKQRGDSSEACIQPCGTSFEQEKWCGCGQNQPGTDGTLYDMTIRRASGYVLHAAR